MKTVLLVALLAVLGLTSSFAQTTPVDTTNGRSYYILLNDGTHIHGRIVRQDSIVYTVRTKAGQLTYVDKGLFKSISGTAPVSAADLTYYTQTDVTRPDLSRPGQTTTAPNQYVISLSDGTTLSGQVLSQDSSRVVIKTNTIGTVYVPADRVLRMERGTVAGNARVGRQNEAYPNLFPQYMTFTPTAYQAERGRVYYRNSMVYFNQFDAGITENWSIGAGFSIFPLINFGWITTKLSVPIGPRARIGVQGQLFAGAFGDRIFFTNISANFIQGILSLGDSQNNLTLGLGFNADRGSSGQLLTIGLVKKVSNQVTLISENQLILGQSSDTTLKLGGGVRLDRRRHSFDFSANVPLYIGRYNSGFGATLIPWISYQVRFGQ